MKEVKSHTYQKYQNQSLMTLSTSNHQQPTKKTIEAEDINPYQPLSHNHRKYSFLLPQHSDISLILTHLTNHFNHILIHAEEDQFGAQMMIQGLPTFGCRSIISKIMDHCCFCCSKGLTEGRLQTSYTVIVITIKREVIEGRCLLTVSNPYKHPAMHKRFRNQVLNPIEHELKSLGKQLEESMEGDSFIEHPYMQHCSPTQLLIQVNKKIYNLFILHENKQLNRYKNIFMHSLQKIKESQNKHITKASSLSAHTKMKPNPCSIIESLINQSDCLLMSLKNSFKQQQEQIPTSYLYSLMTSQTALEISLYAIQQCLCLYELGALLEIYQAHIHEQCDNFNRNIDFINANFNDEQCFNHLELKMKYRLPQEEKPYYAAIKKLSLLDKNLSLRNMLLTIQQTFSEVKTDCLRAHCGRVELSSMDDLLPVMIFVTVRAKIYNFPVLVKIIDDYVRIKGVFQLEQRVITTLYVAIEDICKSWQIKKS